MLNFPFALIQVYCSLQCFPQEGFWSAAVFCPVYQKILDSPTTMSATSKSERGLLLLYLAVCPLTLWAVTVDKSSLGLTSLPAGIPTNVEELNLDTNALTFFVFPDGYSQLRLLSAKENQLYEFPDVRSLGICLVELTLMDNVISFINKDYLTPMVALEKLHLGNNALSSLPDVRDLPALSDLRLYFNQFHEFPAFQDMSKSFMKLQLGNNPLKEVSLYNFEDLPDLWLIGLSSTELQTVPNLCHLPVTSTMDVTLNDIPLLKCDCHLRWLKVLQASGHNVVLDPEPCGQPPALAGVPWSSISEQDLLCTGTGGNTQCYRKEYFAFSHFSLNFCLATTVFPPLAVTPSLMATLVPSKCQNVQNGGLLST